MTSLEPKDITNNYAELNGERRLITWKRGYPGPSKWKPGEGLPPLFGSWISFDTGEVIAADGTVAGTFEPMAWPWEK